MKYGEAIKKFEQIGTTPTQPQKKIDVKKINQQERNLEKCRQLFFKYICRGQENETMLKKYVKDWFTEVYKTENTNGLGFMFWEKPALFDLIEAKLNRVKAFELGIKNNELAKKPD